MPRCTVVVPVFNQAALTAQCLRAQLASEHGEIIVVDDASSDTTRQVLAGFSRRIKVIRHTDNRGFAASCNDGATLADGEYLVFLNNDTVPQPGWLKALLAYADAHPQVAVVGSKLLYPDQTIQHAGVVICQDRYPRHIYSGFPAEHPAVNKSRRFQVVTAACMLVRTAVFRQAGGFDTSFRNGFEDVDFCLRLGEGCHEIHYCADSMLEHLESASPGRFRDDRENVALYRQRWLERVRPDDLAYYVEDRLLGLSYEGQYPLLLQCSPLLATFDAETRASELERVLRDRSEQLTQLQRENTRLVMELGVRSTESPELSYQALRQRITETVGGLVPRGSTVLVASKGDRGLLNLPGQRAWHFLQTEHGAYAGYHPANSAEAISALETLRAKGAAYFVLPATSFWWLDSYPEFRHHLEAHYSRLRTPAEVCALYYLGIAETRDSWAPEENPLHSALPVPLGQTTSPSGGRKP